MTDIRHILQGTIARALGELGVAAADIRLEHPEAAEHGDYATNAALRYAKDAEQTRNKRGTNAETAREFAEHLAENLRKKNLDAVEDISVAGPGFINFRLSPEFFSNAVGEILKDKDEYGHNKELAGKKIIIEYTDPNPFKEFHIGHLMSNAIGESLARLLEFSGAEVKRANYQGDVGLHVAKALWGKIQKPDATWGEVYAYGAQNYEEHKEDINEINKKIYQLCWGFTLGDTNRELIDMYRKGRGETSLAFERIYEKLGMESKGPFGGRKESDTDQHFDFYFKESESGAIGKEIVKENTPQVFSESDGAVVFHAEEYDPKLHTRVFITSANLPTYEAKELGLFQSKRGKFEPLDLSIVITGNEIRDYFKVVLKAAEQIKELHGLALKTEHLTHGMLRLPSGKMSSRTGDVITAESLINEAKERIMKKMTDADIPDKEKVAEEVAIGAIKYSILKHTVGSDIVFDFDTSLSFEGDSGPYLQYAYVRAKSAVNKARESGVLPALAKIPDGVGEIGRLLYQFPEVVSRANTERAPSHVVTYLTLLAQAFNNFYAHERIADSPYRLALAEATAIVLKNGLWILGIKAPERM